ncbi:uncharacterized protein LOC127634937 isoform X2 [Xyrauchen texanus]|uniref:uncharacterized protein LOC127634937 isoform X2 n=1 Tax=Xyrauchen texanus TaxID=154827 RepID=UPI0022423482|nr:uncharacterized protein LOC127634937 isoform X2 [Xyrauchen texanus]XP_051970662.1 uncharacterized protein LOC127634937 isoform X2 [Xyrauchen texanus]
MMSSGQDSSKVPITKETCSDEDGNPVRYRLKLREDLTDESEQCRKMTFGERDKNKPHKRILMVGETGTGKTTLINTMINFILRVQREDKVWFEITDDKSDGKAQSQTSDVTVYDLYLQESSVDLTIIDTPGYGETCGIENDDKIAMKLLSLSKSAEVHEIDAVCLVIDATQTRLSDRQRYIFDAVQSLFGKDIAENIVLLFTHSTGAHPKNALMAVKEAKIKCAVNEKNQPVYFLFDNCQSDPFNEEYQTIQEQLWNLSFTGMKGFFKFLDAIQPRTLKITQDVLNQRKQLEENISKLKLHVQQIEQKQKELKKTQETLEKHKRDVEDKKYENKVEVTYKEKIDTDPLCFVTQYATCCTVCKENCHYPGCWWVKNLSWCSVMKNYHCTVCTNKCHYTKHVKEDKIYETKTKKEKRTNERLKKEYDDKIHDVESEIKKLEEDLQELEKEKIKLVIEAFHCVECLEMIALKTDSLFTLQHIDFLIEKLKEINEPEKAETLKNIKKRSGEASAGALEYMKKDF